MCLHAGRRQREGVASAGALYISTVTRPWTRKREQPPAPRAQGRESIKKADVASAAAVADVPWSDAVYSRVIKDVCESRGSAWFLKSGA